jgi:unsaturated rhamnogalacturonyl hydrolase
MNRALPLAFMALCTCAPPTPAPECDPLITEVVNATLTLDLDRTSWETGVAMQGLVAAAQCPAVIARWPDLPDRLDAWADARVAERRTPDSVNFGAVGGALLGIDGVRDHPQARDHGLAIADYLLTAHPRTEPGGPLVHSGDQLWIDTTFMVLELDQRASAISGDTAYADDVIAQILEHASRMQDAETGLFFHGWDHSDDAAGQPPHVSAQFWGRGNGWVALALARTLTELDPGDPRRGSLQDILRAQLEGLISRQASSGMWRTVLDDAFAYEEASATAAIALALELAVAAEVAPPGASESATSARSAIQARLVDGDLTEVSGSTALQLEPAGYLDVPVGAARPWGQGLALLLLAHRTPPT